MVQPEKLSPRNLPRVGDWVWKLRVLRRENESKYDFGVVVAVDPERTALGGASFTVEFPMAPDEREAYQRTVATAISGVKRTYEYFGTPTPPPSLRETYDAHYLAQHPDDFLCDRRS